MPMVMSPRGNRFMNMPALARGFADRVEKYEDEAATRATEMSRRMSRRFSSGRPLAPARPGRPTTDGAFANYLKWQRGANGLIEFDLPALEAVAPYWLILEIGTGKSSNHGSVKSQKGRRISQSLYWADGPGAMPSRAMSGKKRLQAQQASGGVTRLNQQLYPVADITNAAYIPHAQGRTGLIRREIKGKHYIQDGGLAGFTFLRDEMMADFRRTFK